MLIILALPKPQLIQEHSYILQHLVAPGLRMVRLNEDQLFLAGHLIEHFFHLLVVDHGVVPGAEEEHWHRDGSDSAHEVQVRKFEARLLLDPGLEEG
jgi:hypothetical protein